MKMVIYNETSDCQIGRSFIYSSTSMKLAENACVQKEKTKIRFMKRKINLQWT